MFKAVRTKSFIPTFISIALIALLFSVNYVSGQEDPFLEIKGRLSQSSVKEKDTIQRLFVISQKIDEMKAQERTISNEAKTLKIQISNLQKSIKDHETDYIKKKQALRLVLLSYQRMGPGSYLEILLNSSSLPDLIQRINTLRDLTHNTGTLLEEIQTNKETQLNEKKALSQKIETIEKNHNKLQVTLSENIKLRTELETYLSSLSGEREYYQKYLLLIQQTWSELRPVFLSAIKEFSSSIEKGDFPDEALVVTYNLFDVNVSINEKDLNSIIKTHSKLPKIEFKLRQNQAEIRIPEKNLILYGKFIIVNNDSIKFDVKRGSFLGLSLEQGTIKTLMKDNDLILNFKSQLSGFKINAVDIMDGYLNFSISLK